MSIPNVSGRFSRVLLLGGTSEIGLAILSSLSLEPGAEVILAGRDAARLEAAGKTLNRRRVARPMAKSATVPGAQPGPASRGDDPPYPSITVARYDATETGAHQAFAAEICAGGVPDLVIAATGILIPQEQAERDVRLAATMIETNFTGHVTALLAFGEAMRGRGSGTIVVLSSVAAVRPRKFNSVYGATKAGLDAFARGYADSLHGTGVRVLLVRPGFVTGRMTQGMKPAPLATTPEGVGAAVASALRGQGRGDGKSVVWVPAPLVGLATVMKLIPRPVWRKLKQLSPGGRPPYPRGATSRLCASRRCRLRKWTSSRRRRRRRRRAW
jgi:decaprenylphospho-beta-D-erythro-pentofuranosid-2-ulose 2-reductase